MGYRKKLFGFRHYRKDKSGIILIIVLWILVVLTMLAIGLGQRSSIELSLTKYAVGELKAKYLAWAGLVYSMQQIKNDSSDETTRAFDTLHQCGVRLAESNPEDVFRQSFDEGHFLISYEARSDSVLSESNLSYGFQDEERRININTLSFQNYKILIHLMTLLDVDEALAEEITAAILDWKDEDSELTSSPSEGAEDDYYMGLSKPYHCKNRPFDSVEELMLVRGMTEEILRTLKDYVTIYPKTGNLMVNFDTAPEIILTALGRSAPTANPDDVDSTVSKILSYRRGPDNIEGTSDDKAIEQREIGFNFAESTIFNNLISYRTLLSNFIRVNVEGVDDRSGVKHVIEAVISRN